MSELVSVKGAAERAGISRRTIHRWIKNGTLQRVGDKVRFDEIAYLISRLTLRPRRGPRPGKAHYQVMFRSNGFPVPKAQKRLSDLERAKKISEQLVRIRSSYVLDLLARQAAQCAIVRENERNFGNWTKPEDLLSRLSGNSEKQLKTIAATPV